MLRFSLPEALAQGRLEVTFTRTDDAVGSTDAFITLFNSGNNNAGNILDLRVKMILMRSVHLVVLMYQLPLLFQASSVRWWQLGNIQMVIRLQASFPLINLTIDGVVIPEYTVADSTPEVV